MDEIPYNFSSFPSGKFKNSPERIVDEEHFYGACDDYYRGFHSKFFSIDYRSSNVCPFSKFTIIVAFDEKNRGIGKNGKLAWKLKEDMVFFKNTTENVINPSKINAVIMGRNTFEKCLHGKELKNRINICITSQNNDNIICMKSLDYALNYLHGLPNIEKIFIIGGEQLYKEAICHPHCVEIYANIIKNNTCEEYDTFFPEIDLSQFKLCDEFQISENILSHKYYKIK